MSDDVQVQFGAATAGLMSGISSVEQAIEGLAGPVNTIAAHFKEAGEAIVVALGVEKIIQFAEAMGELGLQTERTMAQIGASAEQVGVLSGIAKLTGGSIEGMATSIERLSLNVQRSTRDAFNPAAQGLKVLGLNAKDLVGIPADEYFDKFATAVGKFNPSLNLTNALMAVGGRGVAALLPTLLQGADGFRRMKEEVDKTGAALTEAQAQGFAKTHEGMTLLGMSVQGLKNALFTALEPALDGAVRALTDFVQWLSNSNKEGGALSPVLTVLSYAAKAFATAIILSLEAVRGLAEAISTVWRLAAGDIADFEANAAQSAKNLEKIGAETAEALAAVWRAHVDVHAKAAQNAAEMDELGKQRLEALRKTMEGEIALVETGLQKKKVLYGADADQFRITEDRKFALIQQATGQAYAAQLSLLQQEAQLDGLSLSEKTALVEKMKQLREKMNLDLIKLDEDSIKAMTQKWKDAFGAIQSSWDSNLKGLLQGTTSWKSAMQNTFLDLTTKLISYFEKMGLEWLATQLGMTTASTTGAAARAAQEIAASEGTLPARAAKFMSDIMAASATTFAGVFANMAPLLGPAAAAPAGESQALVLAQLGNVPKFDVGSYSVPRDMLAMVHAGEFIGRAGSEADTARAAVSGAGGGTQNHFNIIAWDGASVNSWLRLGGAKKLAQAIQGTGRDGV